MRLLNKNTARRAAAAAALLTMTAAMSVGAFAADDTVVAGYLPPQAESVTAPYLYGPKSRRPYSRP